MTKPRDDTGSADDRLARSLGERLRLLRQDAGIDGTQLAERCGMRQAYIWRLEAGRTLPSLRNLARLAVGLQVPLTHLLENVEYEDVELRPRSYDRD
ncbi:helix-turn-helix domain-containing protein [Erythrobacter pelagi]|uniref:Helix-turn-helix domain-containing protein n=1 Tax=Qipengyuania pelagi TaxID=994320 RepID=A0A844Y4I6_9SPHN|nr:helix-turn-helix transcriptional regulator [Qipengyuania pelagi]MXO52429.1 helix-turn-helix domain-containing protein [Qipengyuania pelagi]